MQKVVREATAESKTWSGGFARDPVVNQQKIRRRDEKKGKGGARKRHNQWVSIAIKKFGTGLN